MKFSFGNEFSSAGLRSFIDDSYSTSSYLKASSLRFRGLSCS